MWTGLPPESRTILQPREALSQLFCSLPVSVLEATALTNFRAVTGAFFNPLQVPTKAKHPVPHGGSCVLGEDRPGWCPRGVAYRAENR